MVDQKFIPENYRQCTLTVMDNVSDLNIRFDSDGVSHYCHDYWAHASKDEFKPGKREEVFENLISEIKRAGKNRKYDCLIGLSGGADSSYLAYLAKQHGLRPLIVHFDYGWNTDLAIKNIENVTKKLGFELFTYVIDWNVIRDLQRSYYLASVVDLDVPADHTIFGSIFKIAKKMGIRHLLNGANFQTEFIMPKGWNYMKTDLHNIKSIHQKFGSIPFRNVPTNGVLDQLYYRLSGHVSVPLLQYTDYNSKNVRKVLEDELGWQDYGAKHFENVFTRFYQGYVLPKKFGIDKRKPHLSNLILSGEMTKVEATEELSRPPYPLAQQIEDKEYVAKKLGFSQDEFDEVLSRPNISHEFYGTDKAMRKRMFNVVKPFLPAKYKTMLGEKLIRP